MSEKSTQEQAKAVKGENRIGKFVYSSAMNVGFSEGYTFAEDVTSDMIKRLYHDKHEVNIVILPKSLEVLPYHIVFQIKDTAVKISTNRLFCQEGDSGFTSLSIFHKDSKKRQETLKFLEGAFA